VIRDAPERGKFAPRACLGRLRKSHSRVPTGNNIMSRPLVSTVFHSFNFADSAQCAFCCVPDTTGCHLRKRSLSNIAGVRGLLNGTEGQVCAGISCNGEDGYPDPDRPGHLRKGGGLHGCGWVPSLRNVEPEMGVDGLPKYDKLQPRLTGEGKGVAKCLACKDLRQLLSPDKMVGCVPWRSQRERYKLLRGDALSHHPLRKHRSKKAWKRPMGLLGGDSTYGGLAAVGGAAAGEGFPRGRFSAKETETFHAPLDWLRSWRRALPNMSDFLEPDRKQGSGEARRLSPTGFLLGASSRRSFFTPTFLTEKYQSGRRLRETNNIRQKIFSGKLLLQKEELFHPFQGVYSRLSPVREVEQFPPDAVEVVAATAARGSADGGARTLAQFQARAGRIFDPVRNHIRQELLSPPHKVGADRPLENISAKQLFF